MSNAKRVLWAHEFMKSFIKYTCVLAYCASTVSWYFTDYDTLVNPTSLQLTAAAIFSVGSILLGACVLFMCVVAYDNMLENATAQAKYDEQKEPSTF